MYKDPGKRNAVRTRKGQRLARNTTNYIGLGSDHVVTRMLQSTTCAFERTFRNMIIKVTTWLSISHAKAVEMILFIYTDTSTSTAGIMPTRGVRRLISRKLWTNAAVQVPSDADAKFPSQILRRQCGNPEPQSLQSAAETPH